MATIKMSKQQWEMIGQKTGWIKEDKIHKKAQFEDNSTSVKVGTYGPDAVPMIRLRGKWLFRAGFTPGDLLSVTTNNGQIIINVAEEVSPEEKEYYKNKYNPKPKEQKPLKPTDFIYLRNK